MIFPAFGVFSGIMYLMKKIFLKNPENPLQNSEKSCIIMYTVYAMTMQQTSAFRCYLNQGKEYNYGRTEI